MADQVDLIIGDLRNFTERTVISLTLNITANLQEDTPRDTGWARANWCPSIGAPAPVPTQPKGRPSQGQVAQATAKAEAGKAELLGYKLDRGVTFASNGVVYIGRLNDGWSQQAPAGFVQSSMERGVRQTAAQVNQR